MRTPGIAAMTKHWRRIAFTMLPVLLALAHATGAVHMHVLERLDQILYDARLRATSANTLEERIVIVDIDERSLADVGRWPWGRHHVATLVDTLFEEQKIALLGFDVLFAEADTSSGLSQLNQLAQNEFKDQPAFLNQLNTLRPSLDYDARFAKSLQNRPVVLGYYFASESDAASLGVLPAPVLTANDLQGRSMRTTSWVGHAANIAPLAQAAPTAGFFNPIMDGDGVVRSLPLLAEYQGQYYESLALAMFRVLVGSPRVVPGFSNEAYLSQSYQAMDRVLLELDGVTLAIPVDERAAALVPYRGKGGPKAGSFAYVSAADVLAGRLAPASLKDKIVLLGTTAPGLLDLRTTPVGEAYPGVEAHANLLSGLLDGNVLLRPDYAMGYEVFTLLLAGALLAFGLPLLSAARAVALSVATIALLAGANFWLFGSYGLVLPLATSLAMATTAFALNMSFGYFVESRAKRELANLFGTYVPPELVDEMVKDPDAYSMQATNRELTVVFCDMRGFTKLSESMEPTQLQALLTGVFSRLTAVVRAHRGTIDKYMGDCVMAFWGAPIATPNHAALAVQAATEMVRALDAINADHRARGLPEIGMGIGLNTGTMCVGDMGSDIRRSYTVIGDAVNLGARLEGLCAVYGAQIVASESTRNAVPGVDWQELDLVRVKGKNQAVAIYQPLPKPAQIGENAPTELEAWSQFVQAYRAQAWDRADALLGSLVAMNPEKYLYQLYAERVASRRSLPVDPHWDGSTRFETK
jgi:adenylate cyclase